MRKNRTLRLALVSVLLAILPSCSDGLKFSWFASDALPEGTVITAQGDFTTKPVDISTIPVPRETPTPAPTATATPVPTSTVPAPTIPVPVPTTPVSVPTPSPLPSVATPSLPHVPATNPRPQPFPVPMPLPTASPGPVVDEEDPAPEETDLVLSPMAKKVVELTDAYRIENGLAPLKINPRLNQAAQGYAERMAKENFFDHTDPDGRRPGSRITSTGYRWHLCGENLAKGYMSAEKAVQSWINSPSHKANLLNEKFTEVGVGYAEGVWGEGGNSYPYWVQEFGAPN